MNEKEAVEKSLDIWTAMVDLLKDRGLQAMPMEARVVLFERSHALYISGQIQADRKEAAAAKESKPKSDAVCKECGKQLTIGEKNYCDDYDKPYRCYKCSKK